MKANNLIQMLIGAIVPLHMNAQVVPIPEDVQSASDFSVSAAGGDNTTVSGNRGNFTASGSAISKNDGSSISGAQTITYGGGTFTGSGRLDALAGLLEGEPSMSCSGETSVYIIFHINTPFNYQFQSTVVTSEHIVGDIRFNGLVNQSGTLFKSGTIASNDYVLEAVMDQGAGALEDGQGTWSYSLALTPANIMPGRFSAAQKAAFYAQMSGMDAVGGQILSECHKISDATLRNEFMEVASAMFQLATDLAQEFLDPLDTNYTMIAQAMPPPIIQLGASNGISQFAADDYNAWLTNLSLSAGYNTAVTTCINRAQGAAFAGNSFWDNAQMTAAVQFEAQLASLLDQEPTLRSNLVAQLESDGYQGVTVTTNDVIALQMEITTNGLPADLVDGLTALGVDANTITNIQNSLLTVEPGTLAGSFPETLVNTNLDSSAQALASGLRDASLKLINVNMLPSGQLRFDLPTEPGYNYTIQVSQQLASVVYRK